MADNKHLPVVQTDLDEGELSLELKKELGSANAERRSILESEIDEMRTKWKGLADQREKAFVRKMIMLGHLPPTHPFQ